MTELGNRFRQQLKYLNTSARLFDEGDTDEAMRMAVALRVLFHNTPSSHALLHQMGLESTVKFVDTAVVGGAEIFAGHVVVEIEYTTTDGTIGLAPSGQDGLVEVVPAEDGGGRIVAPLSPDPPTRF